MSAQRKPDPFPPATVQVGGRNYTVYFNHAGYVSGVEVHVLRKSGSVHARRLIARNGPAGRAAIDKAASIPPQTVGKGDANA